MGTKEILTSLWITFAVILGNLPFAARVGNKFDYSTDEADMVLTITSEDPKEVEISEYTPKNGWPITLILPEIVIDDERNEEFSVTSIGRKVFARAEIREVKFPKTMRRLGEYAFFNTRLLGVDLRGIEEIGNGCFEFDDIRPYPHPDYREGIPIFFSGGIRYIVLGSSIKRLDRSVFSSQNLGITMVCYSPEPPLESFDYSVPNNLITYVPVGSIPAYQKAQEEGRWNKYTRFEEFTDDLLLCSASPLGQDHYYKDYEEKKSEFNAADIITRQIGNDIPCVATWTLCEAEDEFGPQPEPVVTWSCTDNAEVTEDGVVTGIAEGRTTVKCQFTFEEQNITGTASIPLIFKDPNSGIESIGLDTTLPERIYDLNGIEVTGRELGHGIYLRVANGRTEKIVR